MAIKDLKQLCKKNLEPLLEECGFRSVGELRYIRDYEQISHGLELPRHRGAFTLGIFWAYSIEGNSDLIAFYRRVGQFCPELASWMSFSDSAAMLSDFAKINSCLRGNILPFLDRFRDLSSLMAAVEGGELSEVEVFGGGDPIWMPFFKGYVLLKLGRRTEARSCLEESLRKEKEWGRDQDVQPILDARRRFTREALRELSVADGVGEVGNLR